MSQFWFIFRVEKARFRSKIAQDDAVSLGIASGLATGHAVVARAIPGRVWRRYCTTADTDVSRWAAQIRA
jgi:hypothetical protein